MVRVLHVPCVTRDTRVGTICQYTYGTYILAMKTLHPRCPLPLPSPIILHIHLRLSRMLRKLRHNISILQRGSETVFRDLRRTGENLFYNGLRRCMVFLSRVGLHSPRSQNNWGWELVPNPILLCGKHMPCFTLGSHLCGERTFMWSDSGAIIFFQYITHVHFYEIM